MSSLAAEIRKEQQGARKPSHNIYRDAIEAFSAQAQIHIAEEELVEFMVEVINFGRGESYLEKLYSEIADVEIVTTQLVYIFGIVDDVPEPSQLVTLETAAHACGMLVLALKHLNRGRVSADEVALRVRNVRQNIAGLRYMYGDQPIDNQKNIKLLRLRKRIDRGVWEG